MRDNSDKRAIPRHRKQVATSADRQERAIERVTRREGKEAVVAAVAAEVDSELAFARKYIGGRFDYQANDGGLRGTAHIDDIARDDRGLIVAKASVMDGRKWKRIEHLWVQCKGVRL